MAMSHPVKIPDLAETNALLKPFKFALHQADDHYEVTGWREWTSPGSSGSVSRFATLYHFWAEWTWFAADTLGQYRQIRSFLNAFEAACALERQQMLVMLQNWGCGTSSELLLSFPEVMITAESLSEDWLCELHTALAPPCWGARFGCGVLYEAIRNQYPSDWAEFVR